MELVLSKRVRVLEAVSAVEKAAWVLVDSSALAMQKAAIMLLRRSRGSGVKYPNLPKRSSAPYEIPVLQKPVGGIVESIKVYPMPLGPSVIAADCGSSDPIVRALDQGTNRVAPRPFMTEASYFGEYVMVTSEERMRRLAGKL